MTQLRRSMVEKLFGKVPATTARRVADAVRLTASTRAAVKPTLERAEQLAAQYAAEDMALRR